jgi:hypothetical protein
VIWFLDSSVLVKRYVLEPGSEEVQELLRRRRLLAASALAAVEIRSALFRRVAQGTLPEATAMKVSECVDDDLRRMVVVQPRVRTIALASMLVQRRRIRAYDAVQLASAIVVGNSEGDAVTFACADDELRAAALGEGLRVFPDASD